MKKILKILGIILVALVILGIISNLSKQKYDYLMGFSASPPELNAQSYVDNIKNFMRVSSMVLFHEEAVWKKEEIEKKITDYKNFKRLIKDKEMFIMIGPLHPTDRTKISPAIDGKNFGNSEIRQKYEKLITVIAGEVKPAYLGIAAEINGYEKVNKEDFANFVSLYNDLYPKIKELSPKTKVFVSFQYEDFLGLWNFNSYDNHSPQWNLIDQFENLDLFAISTYPYVVFDKPSDIPKNYYSQIRDFTDLPIAIAEAGYQSESNRFFKSSEEFQNEFLLIVEDQLIADLEFFAYFQYRDYDLEELKTQAKSVGIDESAPDFFSSIGLKSFDGKPKSAYETWVNIFEKSKVK